MNTVAIVRPADIEITTKVKARHQFYLKIVASVSSMFLASEKAVIAKASGSSSSSLETERY